jgi:hypothetical protein
VEAMLVVVVIIVFALIALIVIGNWLRPGGGYDEETVGRIGPEPADWKPHEAEPWESKPKP